jgi:pyroglutamyl-peptidase
MVEPIVLISGFEPFGGESFNPSEELVRRLHGAKVGRHRVVGIVLPCVFGASTRVLLDAVDKLRPSAVICLGMAANGQAITPERVAINVDDARIPDNAGQQPVDLPIVADGPAAYWSTLPIKAMVRALHEGGWPAAVSESAGTFVCNHVFYGLMHALSPDPRPIRAGFIHIPASPLRPKGMETPSWDFTHAGLRVALRAALDTPTQNLD